MKRLLVLDVCVAVVAVFLAVTQPFVQPVSSTLGSVGVDYVIPNESQPTPTPTPVPTPTPEPVVIAPVQQSVVHSAPNPVPAPPAAAPSIPTITYIGNYGDCNIRTTPPPGVWRWGCAAGNYLIAHNPGAGSWWMNIPVGYEVMFMGQKYKAVSVYNATTALQTIQGHYLNTLTLQTCVVPDGSVVRIIHFQPE